MQLKTYFRSFITLFQNGLLFRSRDVDAWDFDTYNGSGFELVFEYQKPILSNNGLLNTNFLR